MADDPAILTLFGWDASDFDWARGPMDLDAAHRDGIDFFTHKATEGVSTQHRNYGEAMRRARDAGVPVLGAYHVVRTSPSPRAQADYFLAYLNSQTPWWRTWPDWFIQVDLEKWPYDAVPASAGEAFADLVEQISGRKAVIYASRGQYGNELTGTSHDLWNAHYGTNPADRYQAVYAARGGDSGPGWVTYSGRMPVLWQFGSRTTIGTQPICDANAFRGTLPQLKALVGGRSLEMEEPMLYQVEGKAEIYTPRGDGYVHMTSSGALADMRAAGHQIVKVGSLANLEALLGKPYIAPEPPRLALTPEDRAAIVADLMAALPSAEQIAVAAADEEHRRMGS